MSQRYTVCILSNENKDDHAIWLEVLNKYHDIIDFSVIDMSSGDWLDEILNSNAHIFIARPPGISDISKHHYDEKLFIVSNVLARLIYPSLNEVFVYENKKFLSYFLKANKVPHPATYVFYSRPEAVQFIEQAEYPVVAKFNIGASGSGVKILNDKTEAANYVIQAFSSGGAPRRWGPNLEKGGLLKRGVHYLYKPQDIFKKLRIYKARKGAKQEGFLILQEFIKHDFEWRCVRIGDSFFAHRKLKMGNKASGTLLKGYENPPFQLLDYIRELTDRLNFSSLAVDLFETDDGTYLVNELQCYFGQSDPYQMLVDGKAGRYRYLKNKWIFEEGDFAKNACYELRLQHIMDILNET